MKKLIAVVLLGSMVTLVGCKSEPVKDTVDVVETTATPTITDAPVSSSEPHTESVETVLDKLIPMPESNYIITDDAAGKYYKYEIGDATDEMYRSYIDVVKNSGFTNAVFDQKTKEEGGGEFGAYTEDKEFWCELWYSPSRNIISVIINYSNKK